MAELAEALDESTTKGATKLVGSLQAASFAGSLQGAAGVSAGAPGWLRLIWLMPRPAHAPKAIAAPGRIEVKVPSPPRSFVQDAESVGTVPVIAPGVPTSWAPPITCPGSSALPE